MLTMIYKEFIRSLKETLSHKKVFYSDLIVLVLIMIMLLVFDVGSGSLEFYDSNLVNNKVFIIISFVYWSVISASISSLSTSIITDSNLGLLEQKLLGKYSYQTIHIGEFINQIINALVISSIIIIVYGLFINDVSFLKLTISFMFLPISFTGMYGISLIIASFVIIEKKLGMYIIIIQSILLFTLNSSLIYKYEFLNVIPVAPAIKISREFYYQNSINISNLIWLFIVNIIWLGSGLLIFKKSLEKSRRLGTIPTK